MKYWKVTFFEGDFIVLAAENLDDAILDGEIEEITKAEYDEIVSRKSSLGK